MAAHENGSISDSTPFHSPHPLPPIITPYFQPKTNVSIQIQRTRPKNKPFDRPFDSAFDFVLWFNGQDHIACYEPVTLAKEVESPAGRWRSLYEQVFILFRIRFIIRCIDHMIRIPTPLPSLVNQPLVFV